MDNSRKKLIAFLTVFLILFTTFAYSALSTSLTITSNARFKVLANIRVDDIGLQSTNNSLISYDSEYTKNTISSGFKLTTTSSSIDYNVVINNSGNIDQVIYQINTISSNNDGIIIYIDDEPMNDKLPYKIPIGTTTIKITYRTNNPSNETINVVNQFDFRKLYSVDYNTKGGSQIASQDKIENVDLTLTNSTPTKAGYTFAGWTDEENGTTAKYQAGSKYTLNESVILYAIYSKVTYNITYTLNGGTNNSSNPSTYNVETNDITLKDASKAGWTFTGWTGNGTNTPTKNLKLTKGSTGNKTFVAHFEKTITLTQKHGNTTTTQTYNLKDSETEHTFTLQNTVDSYTGWTFDGWLDNPTPKAKDYNPTGKVTISEDKTVYATYKKELTTTFVDYTGITKQTRTVKGTAYGNNECGGVSNQYPTVTSLSVSNYTDWTKLGWTTSTSASASVSLNSNTNYTLTDDKATTYYALYKQDVTLTYDANGGSTKPNDETKQRKVNSYSNVTFSNPTFTLKNTATKTGYTLSKWTISAPISADKNPTDSITIESGNQVTATAKWTANTYTVAYTMNGAAAKANQTVSYNSNLTLARPSKTFTVNIDANSQGASIKNASGTAVTSASSVQTFAGWTSTVGSNAKTGTTTSNYVTWDGTSTTNTYFKNLTDTKNGTVTLIANWTAVNVTLPNITKTGYTCGYAASANGTSTYQTGGSYTPSTTTNTATLFAKCTPNTYTVTYNGNGNTGGSTETSTHTYDTEKALTKNGFTKTGYTFAGWNTKADGTGTNYTDEETVLNLKASGNFNLYAIWAPNTNTAYTVYHYIKDLGANTYTLNNTENKTGTSDANLTLTNLKKTITGFTYSKGSLTGSTSGPGTIVTETTIAADGSTKIYLFYTRDTHTVTLTKGTGINKVTGAGTYEYGASVTINNTLNAGYEFVNWTVGTTSTVFATSQSKIFTMGTSDVTYKANGQLINYSITYNLNGGSVSPVNPTSYNVTTDTFILNNPTKTGYTFTGWTEQINNLTWTKGFINYSTGNIEYDSSYPNSYYTDLIYLKSGVTYTLSGSPLDVRWRGFDLNGTYLGSVSSNIYWTPTSDCYVRIMYYNNPTAAQMTNTVITSNDNGTSITIPTGSTGNRTYTANYTAKTYTLTLKPNGGKYNDSTSDASKAMTYDSTNNNSIGTASKTGYTFTGWWTASSGGTQVYNANGQNVNHSTYWTAAYNTGTWKYDGAVTLYAQFTKNDYTIAFNSNAPTGETATGTMSNLAMKYDEAKNLTSNGYNIAGYTFAGWNTKADGTGTAYLDGASVSNLVTTGTVTLYAQWTINTVTIGLQKDGSSYSNSGIKVTLYDGTTATSFTSTISSGSTATFTKVPAKTYNIYVGEDTNHKTTMVDSKVDVVVNSSSTSQTVKFYTLTIGLSNTTTTVNGTSISNNGTVVVAEGYSHQVVAAANTGYEFVNNSIIWSNTGTMTIANTKAASTTVVLSSAGKLTSTATAKSYVVTAKANDGSIASTTGWTGTGTSATKSVTYKGTYGTLPSVSRTGYTLAGWNTKADGTGTTVTASTTVNIASAHDIYAIWTPNIYHVILNNQDATTSGTTDAFYKYKTVTNNCYYYTTSDLSTCLSNGYNISLPTKTGYTFGGYFTEENGGGTQYVNASGSFVNNIYLTVGDRTLYAKWTANTYTVTYNGNNNTSGSTATSTHTYDVEKTLTDNGFIRTGYTFGGWSTSSSDKSLIIDDTEYHKDSTNITTNKQELKQYSVEAPFTSGEVYQLEFDAKGTGNLASYFYGVTGHLQVSNVINSDGVNVSSTDGYNNVILTSSYKHYSVRFTLGSTGDGSKTKYVLLRAIKGNDCYAKNIRFFKVSSTSTAYTDEQSVINLATTGNVNLYAMWLPNELTFGNQTITKTFSKSSQTANVTAATNGTGTYTYSKVSGESDITVSSAGVITVPASKTVNTTGYSVVIRATDSNSGKTKDATYTIKINKKKGTVTLTDSTKALTYGTNGTNIYTYDGDGTVSCSSSDTTYVTCSLDTTNKKITVTPVKPTSSAVTITVSAGAGTNYSAADNKTFTVTVGKGTLTATATPINAAYTGSAQYAKIKVTKSNWDGKTIVSGTTTSYGTTVTSAGAYNTNYDLKPGYTNVQASTTIYYKITGGTYYNDLTGSTTIAITQTTTTTSLSAITKTYNGSAQAASGATAKLANNTAISNAAFTYTYYNGESCSGTALTSAPVAAGTYSVKATLTGTTNYATSTSSCAKYTMNKRDITVTAASSSRAWNGSALTNSSCTAGTNQLVSGQTVTCTMTSGSTITLASTTANTSASVDNTISTVVIKSGTTDVTNNYNVTTAKGTLTISYATPTISLTAKTADWSGSVVAANSASASPNSTPTMTYTYYTDSNCTTKTSTSHGASAAGGAPSLAGQYYVIASAAAVSQKTNAANSACTSHKINVATPTVTLTAKTDAQRTYTGSAIAANNPTVSPNSSPTITKKYYTDSSCTTGETTTAPTNYGTYYAKAYAAAVTNKTAAASSACVNHSVLKAAGTNSVKITGTNTWGSTLTATITTNSNGTKGYKWYYSNTAGATSGGTAIETTNCNTGNTCVIPQSLVGKYIYVVASVGAGTNWNAASDSVDATDATNNTTQAVAKKTCPAPTNVAIATDKKVSWTNASGASSYQISMAASSGFAAHTNGAAYSAITNATGTRTVYVRSVCDTTYFAAANSANASKSVAVYSVTLTKGTGISSVTGAGNYITGATVTLGATASSGYSWSKWTQTTGGADVSTTNAYSFTLGTSNITYTANAVANPYTVTAKANSGSISATTGWTGTGASATKSVTYKGTYGTLPSISKTGYTLAGWNTKSDGTGTTITSSTTMNTASAHDIYAIWVPSEISLANKTLNAGTYGTAYTSNAFDAATNGTGTYTYTLSNAPTGATINSTNRTISFTASTAAGTYNVTVTATDNETSKTDTATMTIVINKRDVTLTAGSSSRAWNGSALTNSTCTGDNLVSGHTVTCTMTSGSTITVASTTANTSASVNNTISTYVIKSGTTDLTSNYNVTTATGTLTISYATPTVTLTAKTDAQRTYTGSAIAANNATVSPNSSPTITKKYYTNSTCTTGETTTAPTNAGTYYAKAYAAAVSTKTNAASSTCVNHSIIKAAATNSIAISGTNTWGSTLTATITTNSDGAKSYKWYYSSTAGATSGGTAVGDTNCNTGSTCVIPKSLIGKYIYVVGSVGAGTNWNAATDSVDATDATTNTTQAVDKKTLSVTRTNYSAQYDGSAHGVTVKVTNSDWDGKTIVSGTTTSYGTTVASNGAYNTNYTLSPTYTDYAASARTVYYKVTGGTYYKDYTGSGTVTISKKTATNTIKITGTNTWGSTLTATITTNSNGTKSYKWYYSSTAGATSGGTAVGDTNCNTGSTCVIPQSLVGKYIYVVGSVGASTNYTTPADSVDATDATANTTAAVAKKTGTNSIAITGTNTWGSTLTATITTNSNGTKSYKWYYSSTAGATSGGTAVGATNCNTGSTCVIPNTLVGKYIYVVGSVGTSTYYTTPSDSVDATDATANTTEAVAKKTCPAPTNVAIATDKKVSWTNASGASSYQISMSSSSGFAAHTNGAAYNSITAATGTRTVYVRSVCDTTYYTAANSANASKSTTVYSVTLTAGTGISSVSGAGNYITGASASIDATVKTGYTWTNWTGSSTISTKSTSVTVNDNKSYTANATPNTYTIAYTMNGGTNASGNPTSGTYDTDAIISNPASKTFTVNIDANSQGATIKNASGTAVTSATATQTFAGWTSSTVGSNAKTGTTANPTTAWSGTSTKNTYFKNLRESGTVTMVANWNAANATLPNITKSGYLCGYSTTASGNIEYYSGDSYATNTTTNSAIIYAKCIQYDYTIHYSMRGGELPSSHPEGGFTNQDVYITNPSTKTVTINFDNTQGATIKNSSNQTITSMTASQTFKGWTSSTYQSNAKTGTTANPTTSWTGSLTTNTYFKDLRYSGTIHMGANWNSSSITLPNATLSGRNCGYVRKGIQYIEYSNGQSYSVDTTLNTQTLYVRCLMAENLEYNTNLGSGIANTIFESLNNIDYYFEDAQYALDVIADFLK